MKYTDAKSTTINMLAKRKIRIKGVSFVPLWLARLKGMAASRNSDQAVENAVMKTLSSCNCFIHGEKAFLQSVIAPLKTVAARHTEPVEAYTADYIPQSESEKRLADEMRAAKAARAAEIATQNKAATEAAMTIETAQQITDSLCSKATAKSMAYIYAFLSGVSRRNGRRFNIDSCVESILGQNTTGGTHYDA